jgi:hypothetical protein
MPTSSRSTGLSKRADVGIGPYECYFINTLIF